MCGCVVSVLVLVRVCKVNTKVSSQMLDDVGGFSRLEPAPTPRMELSVLAERRGISLSVATVATPDQRSSVMEAFHKLLINL